MFKNRVFLGQDPDNFTGLILRPRGFIATVESPIRRGYLGGKMVEPFYPFYHNGSSVGYPSEDGTLQHIPWLNFSTDLSPC